MYTKRIDALKQAINANNLDLYYLNSSDYHLSEYVPPYFKTIAYFSGFTGSVSTLIVDKDRAYIFVDGRYHIQAEKQCSPYGIEVVKLGTAGALEPLDFIKKNYPGAKVGLDGKRTSIDFAKQLVKAGLKIESMDIYSNLIEDRPSLSNDKLWQLDLEYCGESRISKLEKVKYCLGNKTLLINNLESIAYLLNIRGNDVVYTPVFLAYMVIHNNEVYLFVDIERLSEELLKELNDDGVIVRKYEEYYDFLATVKHSQIILDEQKINWQSFLSLKGGNNKFYNMPSIVEELKAIKNDVEIENITRASIYDGVAMLKFYLWLSKQDLSTLNEYTVSLKLNEIRLNYKAFDLSFAPIVAYNANAAMMHYGATEQDNAALAKQGILLIDSGGQYLEGTTDITRTIALGEVDDEIKKAFTIVLKSMFNLSSVKFMSGMSGKQLDVLARKDIWELGIDYRCGTGHGIGQVLSVHEGPPNIRYMSTAVRSEEAPFRPGYMVSDEPGIYVEGKYGIRCENILICQRAELNEYGQFLKFKTITMCPFDLNLIDKQYLDQKTIDLLNDYHKTVYENLLPYLNNEEAAYLRELTREI